MLLRSTEMATPAAQIAKCFVLQSGRLAVVVGRHFEIYRKIFWEKKMQSTGRRLDLIAHTHAIEVILM